METRKNRLLKRPYFSIEKQVSVLSRFLVYRRFFILNYTKLIFYIIEGRYFLGFYEKNPEKPKKSNRNQSNDTSIVLMISI